MKKIEAIVQPFHVEAIKKALSETGVAVVTLSDVLTMGQQKGRALYRGAEYVVDSLPKVKVEVLVSNDAVGSVVRTIRLAAGPGTPVDGTGIIVLPVDEEASPSSQLRQPWNLKQGQRRSRYF